MLDWKSVVRGRIHALNLTAPAESDLTEELAQHLEDRYCDLIAQGLAPGDAFARVLGELDAGQALLTLAPAEDRLRQRDAVLPGEARLGGFLEGLWRDFGYAVRSLWKNPVFVAFVVLTVAIGIGANTTVFSLLNTLILNPLPARSPGELAAVAGADVDPSKPATALPISYPDLKDYEGQNTVFASLAGYTSPRIVTRQEAGASEVFFAEFVTANYFATLGLSPDTGRFFAPDEDLPGGPAAAVINYATWQARFGGAPDIVGRNVRLNDLVFTVIGVAPRGFIGVNPIFGPDFWLTAGTADRVWPPPMRNALRDRGQTAFAAVARYRPGITQTKAQANLAAIASALAHEYPAMNEGRTATVHPIRDAMLARVGGDGTRQIVFAAAALQIVVGIVLLIACSNVANLLLARSAARRREISIRLAIGASRFRLVRQLLTESALLGLLGGGVGLIFGYGGVRLLFHALPGSANFATPRFDVLVFVYALLLSLVAGFLFGVAPALRASRTSLADALNETGRAVGQGRRGVSLSNALLVGQVAFSFLLLVTAALFLRSMARAYEMDPGFQTAHLAVFSTNAGQASYTRAQTKSFYKEVRDRVSRMPDVASVSWSANMPLWSPPVSGLQVEGRQSRSKNEVIRTVINTIDPAYFDTAGVEIRAGRTFTDMDRDTAPPVVIVNETLAREFWPGGAVGRRLRLPGETAFRQIVGVARTANYTTWGEAPQFCVYVPLEQNFSDAMALYIRTQGDPLKQIMPVERVIHAAGPQIVVTMPRTGRQIIDGGLFSARMAVGMLTAFGLLALALASVGLYGIMAYAATRRHREIGLRMALGASRLSVLRLILGQALSLVLAGLAIGFTASVAAGRLLGRMLYGVSATDPLSIGAAATVLIAVALVACYIPARWASHVDPLTALREI